MSNTDKSELRKGDIVLNGYQQPPNNIYLVVGSTTRKTGPYSRTSYYRTQHIIDGTPLDSDSLFNKNDHKLTRIGYIKIRDVMKNAILAALAQAKETEGQQ